MAGVGLRRCKRRRRDASYWVAPWGAPRSAPRAVAVGASRASSFPPLSSPGRGSRPSETASAPQEEGPPHRVNCSASTVRGWPPVATGITCHRASNPQSPSNRSGTGAPAFSNPSTPSPVRAGFVGVGCPAAASFGSWIKAHLPRSKATRRVPSGYGTVIRVQCVPRLSRGGLAVAPEDRALGAGNLPRGARGRPYEQLVHLRGGTPRVLCSPSLTYPPTLFWTRLRHTQLAGQVFFSAKFICMGKQKNGLTKTQSRPRCQHPVFGGPPPPFWALRFQRCSPSPRSCSRWRAAGV